MKTSWVILASFLLFICLGLFFGPDLFQKQWWNTPSPKKVKEELAEIKEEVLKTAPKEVKCRWTSYYIAPIKINPSGARTILFIDEDGKKTKLTVNKEDYRKGEMEAVAALEDKKGKRRFGYRISKGVWKELPEGSMGMGSHLNSLVPLKHVAGDQGQYPYGSMVFLPEAIGITLGGDTKSDGYFWIADNGGRVDGNHFDIFVGEEELYVKFVEGGGTQKFKTFIYPLPNVPNAWDPQNDKGLTRILKARGFLDKDDEPTMEELREAVVDFQEAEKKIPEAEYGDPDAATTLWFLVQAACEEIKKEAAEKVAVKK